jgi:hypothetical protein
MLMKGGQKMKSSHKVFFSFIVMLLSISVAAPASAATVWTDWTGLTAGAPGAVGTLNGVAVAYSGQVYGTTVINGTAGNWSPNSTFIGGTVTTSPSSVGDIIGLTGGSAGGTGTITFASPIENPVFAIWSLGASGISASFTFSLTPSLEAGGPNSQYGGASIAVLGGNIVSGNEGNGVVQFTGTFNTFSWTNTAENWYGFTVGTAASSVPEPTTMLLLGLGLVVLAGFRRMRG